MAQAPLNFMQVDALVSGGFCVPKTPFKWDVATTGGGRIGIADETGYVALNPTEFLAIDPRIPFCGHEPSMSLQYNNQGTSPKICTFNEQAAPVGQDGQPAMRKVADPTDGTKKCIEFRVAVRDLPDTGDGVSLKSDAKRTEYNSSKYVKAGDVFIAGWRQYVPSAFGFKSLVAGDNSLIFQIHDAALGSGLGPTHSIRYSGGAVGAKTRAIWVNGDDTLPDTDHYRMLQSVNDTDPTWVEDIWEDWIIMGKLHYDVAQNPFTQVYLNGNLIANDTGINCFNDTAMVGTSSHYPKMGIYWYNQAAASWTASRILKVLVKNYRMYVNQNVTAAQMRNFITSY